MHLDFSLKVNEIHYNSDRGRSGGRDRLRRKREKIRADFFQGIFTFIS